MGLGGKSYFKCLYMHSCILNMTYVEVLHIISAYPGRIYLKMSFLQLSSALCAVKSEHGVTAVHARVGKSGL